MKAWLKGLCRRRNAWTTVVLLVGIVAIICVVRWMLPFWDWLRLGGSGSVESHGATLRNIGLLIAGVIALPLALWRSWLAERQTRISEQGLLRDRYQRGAEMLGNELLSARLGGIYALQKLAGDYPDEYHIQVVELFCAFVRHPAQAGQTIDRHDFDLEEIFGQSPPLREDVQAVMNAIQNRSHTGKELERRLNFQLDLPRIHRGRALGTAIEAARECSSESGIMVFETENQPETRSTQ